MFTKILIIAFFVLSSFYGKAQVNEPVWKLETNAAIYGSPTISDNKLFFGNESGELYSVTNSGKIEWEIKLDGGIKSTPAISKKSLIINTSEGMLYAINIKNGKEIWKRKIGQEKRYDLWDYYFSSPLIEEDRIYIGLGDGSIQCLNLDSGDQIWEYQTADVVHATPVISGTSLYIGSFDGLLYKLNKNDGELEWRFDTKGTDNYPKGEIQKAVLIIDDKIYVTCRGNFLYEIDAKNGEELRSYFEPGSWIIATPTHIGNGLVFGTSDTQTIRKVSFDDFKVEWSTSVSMRVYAKILLQNEKLYFGSFDGKVFELNTSGEKLSTYQSSVSERNYQLIYGENGYFRQDILTLYGSNIAAAEELLLTLGGFASDPIKLENNIYLSDLNGTIFCFGVK